MQLPTRKPLAVCAVLGVTAAVVPVVAEAATTRPRLAGTYIEQAKDEMSVGVVFKVSKNDDTYKAKATLCVKGKCKKEVIQKTGEPPADATATEYSPNVVFHMNELHHKVTVKTTLTIGTHKYTYTSHATDVKSLCGSVRTGTSRSGAVPHC